MNERHARLDSLALELVELAPQRIAILGGPLSGKRTLAAALAAKHGVRVQHTEQLRGLDWSESSEVASRWFELPGPWILVGEVLPRALRKFLNREPERVPADLLIWLNQAATVRSAGQLAMAKGCRTVWEQILPTVLARGTEVLQP